MSLCYLRVCAVWRWNRYIVAFFGVSWLSVAASSATGTVIHSIKTLQVETFCTVIIVDACSGSFHSGCCQPQPLLHGDYFKLWHLQEYFTRGSDFQGWNYAHAWKSLPTFSKALLHDSQISYMYVLLPSTNALETIG